MERSNFLTEAKERLDVITLWHMLDIPGQPKKSCRCPFHKDHKPSFSVYLGERGGWRWKCYAGCGEGGPVEFLAKALDIDESAACRRLLELAEGKDGHFEQKRAVTQKPDKKPKLPTFPFDIHRGSPKELHRLANLRGLSPVATYFADERGLLLFGTLFGEPSWIVADVSRVCVQGRRMDGGLYPPFMGLPERKAHSIGGSRHSWPVGTREAARYPIVALCEGGPDLLAAHQLIAVEERQRDVAAVIMLGSSNHIAEQALEQLAGKRIRIFSHADEPGESAALIWKKQLEGANCEVDAYSFAGLLRVDGQPVVDLNDFLLIGADCFEAERQNLEGVLP